MNNEPSFPLNTRSQVEHGNAAEKYILLHYNSIKIYFTLIGNITIMHILIDKFYHSFYKAMLFLTR